MLGASDKASPGTTPTPNHPILTTTQPPALDVQSDCQWAWASWTFSQGSCGKSAHDEESLMRRASNAWSGIFNQESWSGNNFFGTLFPAPGFATRWVKQSLEYAFGEWWWTPIALVILGTVAWVGKMVTATLGCARTAAGILMLIIFFPFHVLRWAGSFISRRCCGCCRAQDSVDLEWYGPDGSNAPSREYYTETVKGRGTDRELNHLIVGLPAGLVRLAIKGGVASRHGMYITWSRVVEATSERVGRIFRNARLGKAHLCNGPVLTPGRLTSMLPLTRAWTPPMRSTCPWSTVEGSPVSGSSLHGLTS